MGIQALLERLNSSATLATGFLDSSILPLSASWSSMCSFTTSALAPNKTIESPSLKSILLGTKAFEIPDASPTTSLYLLPTLVKVMIFIRFKVP